MLYNPPMVMRNSIASDDNAGLTAIFQVQLAGTQARLLVDTGAKASFVDLAFAHRVGLHLHSSVSTPTTPTIQLANGSTMPSTGQVLAPLAIQQFRSDLHAYAADLSTLPCDILVGEPWLRQNKASICYGPLGATALHVKKGVRKISLPPIPVEPTGPNTVQVNAIQMKRQLKQDEAVKCIVVKLKDPHLYRKEGAASLEAQSVTDQVNSAEHDNPDLVSSMIMEQLKLEFADVFQPPPDGLPPDRGTGHLIPLEPGHKPP